MYLPEKSEKKFYINIINILYNNRYIFDNFIVKNMRNAGAVAHIYLQLTTLLTTEYSIMKNAPLYFIYHLPSVISNTLSPFLILIFKNPSAFSLSPFGAGNPFPHMEWNEYIVS